MQTCFVQATVTSNEDTSEEAAAAPGSDEAPASKAGSAPRCTPSASSAVPLARFILTSTQP